MIVGTDWQQVPHWPGSEVLACDSAPERPKRGNLIDAKILSKTGPADQDESALTQVRWLALTCSGSWTHMFGPTSPGCRMLYNPAIVCPAGAKSTDHGQMWAGGGVRQCTSMFCVMAEQAVVIDPETVDNTPEEASGLFISLGTTCSMPGCSAERADVLRGVEDDQQVRLQLLQPNHSQLHLQSASNTHLWPATLHAWPQAARTRFSSSPHPLHLAPANQATWKHCLAWQRQVRSADSHLHVLFCTL